MQKLCLLKFVLSRAAEIFLEERNLVLWWSEYLFMQYKMEQSSFKMKPRLFPNNDSICQIHTH